MAELLVASAAAAGLYTIMNDNNNNGSVINKKENFSNQLSSYSTLNKKNDRPTIYNYNSSKEAANNYVNKQDKGQLVLNDGGRVPSNNYTQQKQLEAKTAIPSDSYFNDSGFVSLTGETMSNKSITHNNMTPFFGSKIKGINLNEDRAESMLDNMTGTGSQSFAKEETAPLFKPEESMQWSHGVPNMNDFMQSRQVSSLQRNNVKPWEEQREAPGLRNGEGFTGFNTGMGSRETWMPKSVDELRVKTNPKLSYDLSNHQGPANSKIKNIGIEGKFEQYKPDTYFVNGPERYLTTVGSEKGSTNRALEVMPNGNRNSTLTAYSGNAGGGHMIKQGAPEKYEGSMRPHVYRDDYGISTAVNSNPTTEYSHGRGTHTVLPNNRVTTDDGNFGGVGGAIGALMAPVMDFLRPSRKENVIGNIRINGNVQRAGAGGEYVYETNKPNPTIRETVGHQPYNLNIQRNDLQNGGGYNISNQMEMNSQRTTTSKESFGNAMGGGGIRVADAEYAQRNNVNRDVYAYTPSGNTNVFNNKINADLVTQRDGYNNRTNHTTAGPVYSPDIQTFGKVHGNDGLANTNTERIQPDLLKAFKENPFTQSLSSY